MKYLYIGIALLVLCLALCITTTAVLASYTEQAVALLEDAQEQADSGNFHEAEQLVRKTMNFWKERHGFLGTILRHAEADDINATFYELVEYAQNGCIEEFEPSCAKLIEQINHLTDMEKPHYYNILSVFS